MARYGHDKEVLEILLRRKGCQRWWAFSACATRNIHARYFFVRPDLWELAWDLRLGLERTRALGLDTPTTNHQPKKVTGRPASERMRKRKRHLRITSLKRKKQLLTVYFPVIFSSPQGPLPRAETQGQVINCYAPPGLTIVEEARTKERNLDTESRKTKRRAARNQRPQHPLRPKPVTYMTPTTISTGTCIKQITSRQWPVLASELELERGLDRSWTGYMKT